MQVAHVSRSVRAVSRPSRTPENVSTTPLGHVPVVASWSAARPAHGWCGRRSSARAGTARRGPDARRPPAVLVPRWTHKLDVLPRSNGVCAADRRRVPRAARRGLGAVGHSVNDFGPPPKQHDGPVRPSRPQSVRSTRIVSRFVPMARTARLLSCGSERSRSAGRHRARDGPCRCAIARPTALGRWGSP